MKEYVKRVGLFACSFRRNGPLLPVSVTYGYPTDPVDGSVLDRSPRWNISVAGVLVHAGPDVQDTRRLWPLIGLEIDQSVYDVLMQQAIERNDIDTVPESYHGEYL